jgi:hypothetical protein
MNTKDFLRMGVPLGQATRRATDFVAKFILGGGDKSRLHEEVAGIVANPAAFVDDSLRGEFAKALIAAKRPLPLNRVAQSVPAASCGGVPPPAPTPGGTPVEPAGEDACATFLADRFRGSKREIPVGRNLSPALRWGEGLEHEAVMQMEKACLLPRSSPSPWSSAASDDGSERSKRVSWHAFRPALRSGRGHRSAMSLPFKDGVHLRPSIGRILVLD